MTRIGRDGYFACASASAALASIRPASDNAASVRIDLPQLSLSYSIPRMKDHLFSVLRVIADGEFHSGEKLARCLDVSRGTVWNVVRALEAAGLLIYKVRGLGYKLAERVSLLDADAVRRHAPSQANDLQIEIVDTCD